MAFQLVPNTASFRIFQAVNGGAIVTNNTIYVRNVAAWSVANLTTTATAIGNAWRDNVMPLEANSSVFDRVEAKDEGAQFGNTAVIEYSTTGALATPLSAALCMYVDLRGTGGSPPRRGGLFISPFTEGDITADEWVSTKVTALATAMTAVDAAIAAANTGNAWVIVSRYEPKVPPPGSVKRSTAVTNTIATRTVNAGIAIQRDRRLGQGS